MDETWWRELSELDDDQKAIIALPPTGSYFISGPPGCGKTNLLLLRANYLHNNGTENIQVVVFNRTLCEFIKSGAGRYDFSPDKVRTCQSLFRFLILEAGGMEAEGDDFIEIRRRNAATLKALRKDRAPIFDAIFLDEAQDYLAEEAEVFIGLAKSLYVTADSRQRIYHDANALVRFTDLAAEQKPLTYHYRSGRDVCVLADAVGNTFTGGYDAILPTSNYKEHLHKSKVDVKQAGLAEQIVSVAATLRSQLDVWPDELLGVITPRIDDLMAVAEGLTAELAKHGLQDRLCVQSIVDGYQPINSAQPIWLSTIHSSKGLEFRCLHMVGMDSASRFGPAQKRLVYTAITRAKTSLILYYETTLPPYLGGAVERFRVRPMEPPSLDSAFGKK